MGEPLAPTARLVLTVAEALAIFLELSWFGGAIRPGVRVGARRRSGSTRAQLAHMR